jgi:HEAT repeat protein
MVSTLDKHASSKKLCADLLGAAPDLYKQHKAILRIMNEGDSSCVSTLIPYTMPDKESILRADAVRALGAVGSPAAVSRLVQMLKEPVVSQQYVEEEDAAILRRAVVDALKSTGDLSALPVLESVASSRNEYQSVREMAQIAAEALSKEEK